MSIEQGSLENQIIPDASEGIDYIEDLKLTPPPYWHEITPDFFPKGSIGSALLPANLAGKFRATEFLFNRPVETLFGDTISQKLHKVDVSNIEGLLRLPSEMIEDPTVFKKQPEKIKRGISDFFDKLTLSPQMNLMHELWGYLRTYKFSPISSEIELKLMNELNAEVLTLEGREVRALAYHYGLLDGIEKSWKESGHEFEVTKERFRQIHAKALRKLRHPYRTRSLRKFIPILESGSDRESFGSEIEQPELKEESAEAEKSRKPLKSLRLNFVRSEESSTGVVFDISSEETEQDYVKGLIFQAQEKGAKSPDEIQQWFQDNEITLRDRDVLGIEPSSWIVRAMIEYLLK